jgi:hypothetical protein
VLKTWVRLLNRLSQFLSNTAVDSLGADNAVADIACINFLISNSERRKIQVGVTVARAAHERQIVRLIDEHSVV